LFNKQLHAMDSNESMQQQDQDINRGLALLILIAVSVVGASWLFSVPVYFDLKIAVQILPLLISAILLFAITRIYNSYLTLLAAPLGYISAFLSWSYVIYLNSAVKPEVLNDLSSAQMLGMSNSVFILGLCLLVLWLARYFKFAIYLSSLSIVSLVTVLLVFSSLPINVVIAALLLLSSSAVIGALGLKSDFLVPVTPPASQNSLFEDEEPFLPAQTYREEELVPELEINKLPLNESSVSHDWDLILKELHGELKNTADVDQLFKRMLVFMHGAMEYNGAAVGMLQHKSIKKIAQYGEDEYVHSRSLSWNNERIKEVFASREPILSQQNNLSSSRTDMTEPVHRLDIPIVSSNKVIGLVSIFREVLLFDTHDIHLAASIVFHSMVALKVARLQEEVKRLSSSSSAAKMTLYSREQFVTKVKPVMDKLNKPRECSIFIAEIDNHDMIIDTVSRDAGALLYKAVSKTIMSKLTEKDVLGSYGKDGFIVLMDETDMNEGKARADEIREKVSKLKIKYEDTVLSTTISIGLTIVSNAEEDLAGLMRKADMGLFVAKENGCNTVKVSL